MRNRNTIILAGLTAALAVGTILFISGATKKRRIFVQSKEVADEGYETALDILFPLKSQLKRNRFRAV